MIYVLSSQTRGSKSLGSATDATVTSEENMLPYPSSEAFHLVSVPMVYSCLCIICSQTRTAMSTCKSCLHMGAGCCSSTASWPPTDLFRRNGAVCKRGPGCTLRGFPYDTAERVIPALTSAIACVPMASASRGILYYCLLARASKAATSMVHDVGRVQKNGAGQGIVLKLMACPLAPRCVTTYRHLDANAKVLLTRSCTPVRR